MTKNQINLIKKNFKEKLFQSMFECNNSQHTDNHQSDIKKLDNFLTTFIHSPFDNNMND